jgi:hypothetical protein
VVYENCIVRMKNKIFTVAVLLFATSTNAQWSGPINGTLNTSNFVNINRFGIGTGPSLPLLSLSHDPGNGVYYPLHVTENRVGIGTNNPQASFHVLNNLLMTRSNNTEIFKVNSTGLLRLTTDGIDNNFRGFYINNGNNDFFALTQSNMYYNGKFTLKGDLVIKDNNNDVQYRLYQDGLIRAREVKVDLSIIPPDYVFEAGYKLMPLKELDKYIKENKHLPRIPSAKAMQDENGIQVGYMQLLLLEKVEELTLYLLQLKEENEWLKQRITLLEQQ